jgi:glycine betaine catabolism B
MFTYVDKILNKIPMYRITLCLVAFLWIVAISLGFLGMLPYNGAAIALSGIFFVLMSWVSNELFGWAFNATVNHESAFITGLILALIVSPATSVSGLGALAVVAMIAMGSKYILAIRGKHIFNPAAVAVVIMSFLGLSASWWIGTGVMFPFVAVGGYLLIRKISRQDMVLSFIATSLIVGVGHYLFAGLNLVAFLQQTTISSGLIFLATVMLTEPMTTPPTRILRIIYGALMGILVLPFFHIGSIYLTPELALVVGNIFVYLVSPKQKLLLTLKKKVQLSDDLYDFIFETNRAFQFRAGQYLEWTLDNVAFNMKGNRRYFTIASSPSEREVRVGIRLQNPISEFKKKMLIMKIGDQIAASQLSGDFVLPNDRSKKLAFIAGGIGITPFRSMVKNLVDTNDHRPTTLFYTGKSADDIIYSDVFEDAREKLGMKTVYTVTDKNAVVNGWNGNVGRISQEMIKKEMPDYKERFFYISGSLPLVSDMVTMLHQLGIQASRIKTDYFPGFA